MNLSTRLLANRDRLDELAGLLLMALALMLLLSLLSYHNGQPAFFFNNDPPSRDVGPNWIGPFG